MKNERLAYAFGKIDDDLIYGAVHDTKKKYGWRRWIAAAACVCLVAGAAAAIWTSGGKKLYRNSFWPQQRPEGLWMRRR